MRHFMLLPLVLAAACTHQVRSISSDAALGRVVIYRNGVAFYERKARIEEGRLTVRVPRERVDDFLKSLTVVDPITRKPLAVSIPRQESEQGSYLTMSLETQDRTAGDVLLTYVTEAPAWKPSYRVVVGKADKVMLEGWAVVDNVSGEDWKGVLVGVGASSALSFRYDLWSVRRVDRDLLEGDRSFAVAPPTGMSPYDAGGGDTQEVTTLAGDEVRMDTSSSAASSLENRLSDGTAVQGTVKAQDGAPIEGTTVIASGQAGGTYTAITDDKGYYSIPLPPGTYLVTFYYADKTIERSGIRVARGKTTPVFQSININEVGGETIKIADVAPTIDPASTSQGITIDKNYLKNVPVPGRSFEATLGSVPGIQNDSATAPPVRSGDRKLGEAAQQILKANKDVVIEAGGLSEEDARKRAESVKNKLVDDGIPAARIHTQTRTGDNRVRVLAVAQTRAAASDAKSAMPDTPVGESHFMTERPMTVKNGTSAMVAMVTAETRGGVVYLYDPVSDRGDERYAFKAVRLDNPTDDTLEPGPVTVYGEGRFIGEGITEPVPPRSTVVVPFALDRQIVVTRNDTDSDRIARIITVERGVLTAEVQHRRTEKFTLTSRLRTPSRVYLRHRLQSGWTLVDAPSEHTTLGDSKLFAVDLGPNETRTVTIAEATPVERRLDLNAEEPLDMMKLFVDEPDASPKLKGQIDSLLSTHREAVDLVDKIATLRDQLTEYRQRTGELHAQLVTLRAVRTGGELIVQLKQRLGDMNERTQKATLAIVDAQEKLMLARVRFQNQLADLRLIDVTQPVSSR